MTLQASLNLTGETIGLQTCQPGLSHTAAWSRQWPSLQAGLGMMHAMLITIEMQAHKERQTHIEYKACHTVPISAAVAHNDEVATNAVSASLLLLLLQPLHSQTQCDVLLPGKLHTHACADTQPCRAASSTAMLLPASKHTRCRMSSSNPLHMPAQTAFAAGLV